jgi:galactokinase
VNRFDLLQVVRETFLSIYKKEPFVFAAPGRVNLIGEHTDYNEGYVLPGAVDKRIYVAIAKNDASQVNVFARSQEERCSFALNDRSPRTGWINYLMGVHSFFRDRWEEGEGVDVVIDGDIPIGAGMSSSAALCTGFAYALRTLFQTEHSLWDMAFLSQKAEHEFAGVRCGIMDQFACLHGKKDFVIQLDCRSLEYSYIPFDFPGHCIVLVNTGVTHSLASGEYNIRREQCEEGVRLLQRTYGSIRSLRDVTIDMLVAHRAEIPELIWKRCMYVAEENDRLLRGCAYLLQKDLGAFGKCMYASHQGLRVQYAVSCPELDFLVAEASGIKGVAGARMMGGGFGGCTINIVERSCQDLFIEHMTRQFSMRFGSEPPIYVMQLEDGVRQVL